MEFGILQLLVAEDKEDLNKSDLLDFVEPPYDIQNTISVRRVVEFGISQVVLVDFFLVNYEI